MAKRSIAALNDAFRKGKENIPGKKVCTSSIPPEDRAIIFDLVQTFDDFHEGNDPHGEHDFGAFEYNGQKYFWKIDYYAADLRSLSEDPTNLKETFRVLTILLASEY